MEYRPGIFTGLLRWYKPLRVPSPLRLHTYMARVPMRMFHQTFLEAVWPIGVVWNGSLITIEITDSGVCLHYDRQKLKCIKHCNPSSGRWGAGVREFRGTDYPLLNKGWRPDSSVMSRLLATTPPSKMNECNQWGRRPAEGFEFKHCYT